MLMTKFDFNNTSKEPTLEEIKNVIDKQNHYQRLGISPNATQDEIKKAFRQLSNKYHPDRYQGSEEEIATYIFARISDAYDVLSDLEKRKKYDWQISANNHSSNNNAYNSYTKSREEAEEDFDKYIKDYLDMRRKLNELYSIYIKISLKNFQNLKNFNRANISKNFLGDLFFEYILTQIINTLLESMYSNNNINPVRILMILFSELEYNDCEFYDGYISEKNLLFILLARELDAIIDMYTDRNNKDFEKTIIYLLEKYLSTLNDMQHLGRTTYRSVVTKMLEPIIINNKDFISLLIKKYGRH